MANSTFHIGELSNLFNISVDSIRYYEKKGLICPTYFHHNGNVRYGAFYYKGKDGSSSKEKGADCQPDSVFASRTE